MEHECGRIDQAEFERGIAELLAPRGITVPAPGFVDAFQALLKPDEEMIAAMLALRAAGVPVAIVSNSLGDDAYRGYDLAALADTSVISGEVGVRKPSRAIYELACTRLGVEPADCVMIDDLEHNLRGAGAPGHHRAASHGSAADGRHTGGMVRHAHPFPGITRQEPFAALINWLITDTGTYVRRMTEPLRDRLRAALPAAMKARDRATASTLRATLAAIENAEAVDATPVRCAPAPSRPARWASAWPRLRAGS